MQTTRGNTGRRESARECFQARKSPRRDDLCFLAKSKGGLGAAAGSTPGPKNMSKDASSHRVTCRWTY